MSQSVKLVWLASYPKSGNTWVRFLLANAFWGPIRKSSLIETHIPDMHQTFPFTYASMHDGYAFAKTHVQSPAMLPYSDITGSIIYIIRNPLDVTSSLLHYAAVPDELRHDFIDNAIQFENRAIWRDFGSGAWYDHVINWAVKPVSRPILVIFYENLIKYPTKELARILSFLRITRTNQEIDDAVRLSSFDALKSLETREIKSGSDGFFLKERVTAARTYQTDERRFMRQGTTGTHQSDFSSEQIERAVRRFSPLWIQLLQRHNAGVPIPLTTPCPASRPTGREVERAQSGDVRVGDRRQ
jgi:hypothetical protein